jgi:N-acetylglucosamine kinase-like BadF-type ATPase
VTASGSRSHRISTREIETLQTGTRQAGTRDSDTRSTGVRPTRMRRAAARPVDTRQTGTRQAGTRGLRASWIAGVDAGGTWIRLVAVSDAGRVRALAVPASAGPLPEVLRALWRRIGLSAARVDALVVASRGIWTPGERRAAARRLAGLARRVRVISDVEAAHAGALGGAPGVLLLAGTGSIALARDARGRWARAGGLGPLLGDAGSAFAIGRDWLVAEAAGGMAARALALGPEPVASIAALASAVLARARRGDGRARRVVAGAQTALAALVVDLVRRLALPRPVPASWAGGLLDDARFRSGVWRAVRRSGLAVAPRAPRGEAVEAAVAMARALGRRAPATPTRDRPGRRGPARPSTSRRRRR